MKIFNKVYTRSFLSFLNFSWYTTIPSWSISRIARRVILIKPQLVIILKRRIFKILAYNKQYNAKGYYFSI